MSIEGFFEYESKDAEEKRTADESNGQPLDQI